MAQASNRNVLRIVGMNLRLVTNMAPPGGMIVEFGLLSIDERGGDISTSCREEEEICWPIDCVAVLLRTHGAPIGVPRIGADPEDRVNGV
jgi:hypothetical protein